MGHANHPAAGFCGRHIAIYLNGIYLSLLVAFSRFPAVSYSPHHRARILAEHFWDVFVWGNEMDGSGRNSCYRRLLWFGCDLYVTDSSVWALIIYEVGWTEQQSHIFGIGSTFTTTNSLALNN